MFHEGDISLLTVAAHGFVLTLITGVNSQLFLINIKS